ncbi:MAG: NUDIX domain-containing protein [Ginsengibacter sp.]
MMFNVRVYGILINEKEEILISDEYIRGQYYSKFPGGGLEQGEGTRDCLKREFLEEMNLKIEVTEHIYTTDFYQKSAFNADDQIISIYYSVNLLEPINFVLTHKEFDFTEDQLKIYKEKSAIETFRFVDLKNFSAKNVSFPIDKVVADLIQKRRKILNIKNHVELSNNQ